MSFPDFLIPAVTRPQGFPILNRASRQSQRLVYWIPAMADYGPVTFDANGILDLRLYSDSSTTSAVVSNPVAGAPRMHYWPAVNAPNTAGLSPVGDGSYFNLHHAGGKDRATLTNGFPPGNLPVRTLSIWVYVINGQTAGLGTSTDVSLLTVDGTDATWSLRLYYYLDLGHIYPEIKFGIVRQLPTVDGQIATSGLLDLNKAWIHVAGVIDSHGISLYLNGRLSQRLDVAIQTLRQSIPGYVLGATDGAINASAIFSCADARVYDRALSAGEIWELYDPRSRNELYEVDDQKILAIVSPGTVNINPCQLNLVSYPIGITGGTATIAILEHSIAVNTYSPSIVAEAALPPIGESTYPGAVDTARTLLQGANNNSVTLASAVALDAMTLNCTGDLSDWPSSGVVTLDIASGAGLNTSEICYYGRISGNTIYLSERGRDGTAAKAFAAGALVEMRQCARYHNVLAEAIIATETEVDKKLPIAGGTMSGPLMLATSPTSPFQAATKAYVDSSGGGSGASIISTYYISSFNASGSAAQTTGSINAGTPTLTVANAASFLVGHGVYVAGAGPADGVFISTISAISGNVLTLSSNAATTVVGALVQHDDTVAIQNALNLLWTEHCLTLIFDNTSYRVNGPINPSTNSILTIPYDGLFNNGTPRILRLFGQSTFVADVLWYPSGTGTIIQTDKVGVDSNTSILNARSPYLGNSFSEMFNMVNLVTVDIRDLTFRTYDNPNISGLDLLMTWNVFLQNVNIDTGMPPEGTDFNDTDAAAEPTHNTFGVRLPRNCTVSQTNNLSVACFGIGVIYSDLWVSVNTFVIRCKTGLYTRGHDYPINGTLLIVQCPTGIHIEGSALGIPGMDCHIRFEVDGRTEPPAPYWHQPILNRWIYDPTDVLFGRAVYHVIRGFTGGMGETITTTGTSKLTKTKLWPL